MGTHRILFQAPATTTRDVDLLDGLTDPAAILTAAEDQGVDLPVLCNSCETHLDLSDDWKPVAKDGTSLAAAPTPDGPSVLVAVIRYAVSLFATSSTEHRYFTLYVEERRAGWIVHDGHQYYGPRGQREYSESTAHRFPDPDTALALARDEAPRITVNGRTALDVYRATRA